MNRLIFLDYLRVFAFLSVLIGHKYSSELDLLLSNQNVHITIRDLVSFLKPFYVGGGAGVIVFFVISGYIILKVASVERPTQFIFKRFFRIYPVYIAAIITQLIIEKYVNHINMPPYSEIFSRILLVGDIYGTPPALGGVEWSLRIEVFFYLFIFALNLTKIINCDRLTLAVMASTIFAIQLLKPLPQISGFNYGYFTLYFPFLFIGSSIYLFEKNVHIRPYCIALIIYVMFSYLIMSPTVNLGLIGSNFVICGVILFTVLYVVRDRLPRYSLVTFLSGLTYTVYLFHNWIWDYIEIFVSSFTKSSTLVSFSVPLLLFLICFAAHRLIELPSIKFGNKILNKCCIMRQ